MMKSVLTAALIFAAAPVLANNPAIRIACEKQPPGKSREAKIDARMKCFFYHLGIVEAAFSSGRAGGEKICGYYAKDPVDVAANLVELAGVGYTESFASSANGTLEFMFQCEE